MYNIVNNQYKKGEFSLEAMQEQSSQRYGQYKFFCILWFLYICMKTEPVQFKIERKVVISLVPLMPT